MIGDRCDEMLGQWVYVFRHKSVREHYKDYTGVKLIYIGPIPNQNGHCFVTDYTTGRMIVMHDDDLIELSEDET